MDKDENALEKKVDCKFREFKSLSKQVSVTLVHKKMLQFSLNIYWINIILLLITSHRQIESVVKKSKIV